jgi:hypothetical protein
MPDHFATPANDLDRAARGAFHQVVDELGAQRTAQMFDVNRRTVDRIYKGERDVPPGLARDIAARIDEIGPDIHAWHADALTAWADSREHDAINRARTPSTGEPITRPRSEAEPAKPGQLAAGDRTDQNG